MNRLEFERRAERMRRKALGLKRPYRRVKPYGPRKRKCSCECGVCRKCKHREVVRRSRKLRAREAFMTGLTGWVVGS